MSLVIGLHGAKGSGKDLFFELAKKNFPNLNINKIAYADPIKQEVMEIFDLATEEQYDLFKRGSVSYQLPGYLSHQIDGRRVVREIGMLMRGYDVDQFTRYVENNVTSNKLNQVPIHIWCVTDLRFDNELQSLKRIGAAVVKVKRPGVEYDGHVSETEFPDDTCSYVIYNRGSIDDYEQEVIRVVNMMLQTVALI